MTKLEFEIGMQFRLSVDNEVQPILYQYIAELASVAWVMPDGTLQVKAFVIEENARGVRVAARFFGNRVEAFLFFENMVPPINRNSAC